MTLIRSESHTKIIVGTAQLGMKYGIKNIEPMDEKECHSILECAYQNSLMLDTAEAYGNSLERISHFTHKTGCIFGISSKIILSDKGAKFSLKNYVNDLRHDLQKPILELLHFHRYSDYCDDNYWTYFQQLKRDGELLKIGVSIYEDIEAEEIMNNLKTKKVDVVQIPFSLFYCKTDREKTIEKLHKHGIEVHVRSVFLQGLIFMDAKDLPPGLACLASTLNEFNKMKSESGYSSEALALSYVLQHPFVDAAILGIDNRDQLEQILKVSSHVNRIDFENILKSWKTVDDLDLLNPAKWVSS